MNRRKNKRHIANIGVTATRDGEAQICESIDVSISGMKLFFQESVNPGDEFVVNFRLPMMDDDLELFATVAWVDRINPRIAGIKFDEPIGVAATYAIDKFKQ